SSADYRTLFARFARFRCHGWMPMKEPALKKSDACRSLDIVHKVVHELTLACNNENVDFVMPAWIAGIQVRKDASGNIRVDLPALHAGMTQSRRRCLESPKSLRPYFQRNSYWK